MPTRPGVAPAGAPTWIDISTSDEAKTHAFYGELFGWTVEVPEQDFGGYKNFVKDGIQVAGCMPAMEGAPDAWSIYLETPDPEKVAANAASVIAPPMDVADLGTMVIVTDPGGAVIGGWRSREHKGFGIYGEPGTPSWFELHTSSYDAVVAFYTNVFAWDAHTTSDEPTFRYTTYGEGEGQLAGIMDAGAFGSEGEPPGWSIYFKVADTDATIALATKLGATVVSPAEDTPYGRLAHLLDPNGASFKLQQ